MISDLVARWKLQAILVQFEQAVACFTRARPRRIAYRIVGNAADAEDIVQDVRIRWPSCDRSRVQAPAAFLAKDCGVGHLSQHDELRGLSKPERRAAECSGRTMRGVV